MTPFRALLLISILTLAGGSTTGCVTAETLEACEKLDDFLLICHFNCEARAAFHCEGALELKDTATRELLSECAACLYEGAANDSCGDCAVGGYSCETLLESHLEVSCFE